MTAIYCKTDIVLSLLWILLSLTGIILQMYNSSDSNRTPFPAPTSCSHPHRERRLSRRALYEIEERRNSNRRLRNTGRRWSPVPSAPVDGLNNPVVDERSSLLYSNYNFNDRRSVFRGTSNRRHSPPPDYDHITNANQREYLSI